MSRCGVGILIQVNSAVGELAERSLLLQLCSDILSAHSFLLPSAPSWPVHRVLASRDSDREGALCRVVDSWCGHTGCLLGVLQIVSMAHACLNIFVDVRILRRPWLRCWRERWLWTEIVRCFSTGVAGFVKWKVEIVRQAAKASHDGHSRSHVC